MGLERKQRSRLARWRNVMTSLTPTLSVTARVACSASVTPPACTGNVTAMSYSALALSSWTLTRLSCRRLTPSATTRPPLRRTTSWRPSATRGKLSRRTQTRRWVRREPRPSSCCLCRLTSLQAVISTQEEYSFRFLLTIYKPEPVDQNDDKIQNTNFQ